MRSPIALLFAGLATALPSQGVVSPLQIGQLNPLPGLNAGSVPGTAVARVHMVHLPGDPPNVFYCAASVTGGLPAAYGGVGGPDFVCGSYDVLTDTFTPSAEAAALNTPGEEHGLMLHHSGLWAVFETYNPSGIWLASRPATGQPWQLVGLVVMSCPCHHSVLRGPALADYYGQTHLLYERFQIPPGFRGIVMTPIDLTSASINSPDTLIVDNSLGLYQQMTPIPITDPNGELIGVSHTQISLSPVSRDHYLSLDLDPSTPPVLTNGSASPYSLGGFVGGRFFAAEWIGLVASMFRVFAIDTVWFTGGRAAVGGTMHVRLFSPPTSGPEVYLSLFAVSPGFLPAGQPLPPLQGQLGIQAAGAWTSGLVQHNNLNGEAQISLPIPNLPAFSGLRLAAQSATLEGTSGAVYLGNTAVLVVE